jgi:F-box domain
MKRSMIQELPEEVLFDIIRQVEGRFIKTLRLVSRTFARITKHRLHPHLYLSSHGPDISLYQRVVKDEELAEHVHELIWDDTTFPSLPVGWWFVSKVIQRYGGDYDSYRPTLKSYRLWKDFVQDHQRIRTAAFDQFLLDEHLSRFRRLRRVTLTNIDADSISIASLPESLPTIPEWHRWRENGDRVPFASSVSWNWTHHRGSKGDLMRRMSIGYQAPTLSFSPQLVPFRGLLILLRALTKIPNSVEEFVIKPLHNDLTGQQFEVGISHLFFLHWHEDLARMETLFGRLTKLQLIIASCRSCTAGKVTVAQGHLTRVLSGAKLLCHLELEAKNMGCMVKMLGVESRFSHLRHVSFSGDIDPGRLRRFSTRHQTTLSTLHLHGCMVFQDETEGDEVEEIEIENLLFQRRSIRAYIYRALPPFASSTSSMRSGLPMRRWKLHQNLQSVFSDKGRACYDGSFLRFAHL